MDWAASATVTQAGASIIALVVSTIAVVVPARQQKRRERLADQERALKRRCLAVAIRLDLGNVAVSLGKTKITATGQSFLSASVLGGTVALAIEAAALELPPTLAATADQVYLLGDPAGPLMLRLLAILALYNNMVEREANLCLTHPAVSAAERWGHVLGFIEDIQPKIDEALGAIGPIADGG